MFSAEKAKHTRVCVIFRNNWRYPFSELHSIIIKPIFYYRCTFSDLYGPSHDLLHVHLLTLLTGEVLVERPPTGIFWMEKQTHKQLFLKGNRKRD